MFKIDLTFYFLILNNFKLLQGPSSQLIMDELLYNRDLSSDSPPHKTQSRYNIHQQKSQCYPRVTYAIQLYKLKHYANIATNLKIFYNNLHKRDKKICKEQVTEDKNILKNIYSLDYYVFICLLFSNIYFFESSVKNNF